jgi:hypothetical protein
MANFFKEELNQFGHILDSSIQKASTEIQGHIDVIGSEISKQRTLTKDDIKEIVDYSADVFGKAIDTRIEKAKVETATLVTEKLNEIRQQLSQAADEQKQVAVRNATVAVSAAIIIGVISLLYQKFLHGEVDLITIFRVALFAFACGHVIWLIAKYVTSYLQTSKEKRNIIFVGAQYLGIFKVRGAGAHFILFLVVAMLWATLNFWPQISALVGR